MLQDTSRPDPAKVPRAWSFPRDFLALCSTAETSTFSFAPWRCAPFCPALRPTKPRQQRDAQSVQPTSTSAIVHHGFPAVPLVWRTVM
jgi:hypothetical protein